MWKVYKLETQLFLDTYFIRIEYNTAIFCALRKHPYEPKVRLILSLKFTGNSTKSSKVDECMSSGGK